MSKLSIRGQIISEKERRPVVGFRVEAWGRASETPEPRPRPGRHKGLLGAAISDAAGHFKIDLGERQNLGRHASKVGFRVFVGKKLLAKASSLPVWSPKRPNRPVVLVLPAEAVDRGNSLRGSFEVAGRVTDEQGVAVAGARVVATDLDVDGETVLGEVVTDAQGRYVVAYDPADLDNKGLPDLVVRVHAGDDQKELQRSATRYRAGARETVDFKVRAKDVPRATEWERLLDAIAPHLGDCDLGEVSAAKVTHVAGKSGWDARVVAMAAEAAQLSAENEIPAAHYYALFRAGVAGRKDAVDNLSVGGLERSLRAAAKTGIIDDDDSIDGSLDRHRELAGGKLKELRLKGAMAPLGEMLSLSLDEGDQKRFLGVFLEHKDQPEALWGALAEAGFDDKAVDRLQTHAKLGSMSLQNRTLVSRILENSNFEQPADLVRMGLYESDAWEELIGDDVPDGLTRTEYAQGLAAQVQLSYPSRVTAELVRRDTLAVGPAPLRDEVARFLAQGDQEEEDGKAIGTVPVKTWNGYQELTSEAQGAARSVERMYQMSPSNSSMIVLGQNGLDSARRIMSFSKDGFMSTFGDRFGSLREAELVYHKAQEVHATTLNVATAYLTQRSSPNVYTITGQRVRVRRDAFADVPGAPTLEELFTNLDYCACEHCKSVLSPAAYMVELLQFIDLTGVPHEKRNPLEVLNERRPDLKHILLSCENTNVVLPYVDIVNEILEHYILNGNLDAFAGFNMREDNTSADLLADPEFVAEAAYVQTKSKVYPWNLPFDMPLAAIRLLLGHLDIELADAWSVFRSAADARRAAIGLSSEEYSILTDTGFRTLPEYFGEPASSSISQLNDAVADGKTFSRRTAISHEELVALLKTRFINPGPDLITLTDTSPEPVECDFAEVELRLALPDMTANQLTAFEYHKLSRFIRLWKKLGWSLPETDELIVAFLVPEPADLTLANLDAACGSLLDRTGNFLRLVSRLSLSKRKRAAWLKLWSADEEPALRRERLARLLRIGITDLEHLVELAGVDPLASDMDADQPSIQLFVDLYQRLKALGLKVTDLDYLLRNSDDTGTLTPGDEELLRDLKSLRDALTAVEVQLRTSPESLDLAYAQSRMALVYDLPIVESFFGLVAGSSTYAAPFVMAEEVLPQKLIEVSAALGYDPFAHQLTFTGVLPAATHTALDAAADTLTLADVDQITDQPTLDGLIADFKTATQILFDAGAADLQAFADEYPELKAAYDTASALEDPEAQATAILEEILPNLRRQLKETALLAGLIKLLDADTELLEGMLAVTAANNNPIAEVLGDFLALEDPVAFDANGSSSFYLDPPSQDDYILYVRAPQSTTVTLTLDGDMVIPATAIGASGELRTQVEVALEVGTPLFAELTLGNLPADTAAEIAWRSRGITQQSVPATRLYGAASVAAARDSLLRLRKQGMLVELLRLTPAELTYFAADNTATAGFVNEIPVAGVLAGTDLESLWSKVAWLVWFAEWKRGNEGEENTFVGLLEEPDQSTPEGDPQFARANDGSPEVFDAVLTAFGLDLNGLSELNDLRRVVDAMRLLSGALYPAADLVAWSSAEPDAALFTAAKVSLRERLDDKPWRDLLKGVNDELRNLRQDAMVSYILHHQPPAAGIVTPEHLYEHFLVDVQMDACRQTSRIRQALSSIQLFITRCLMNLEDEVAASSIREDHWQWMKRYRVWEANRKVFLYPENWLEPELRDGKSPFFRELESELLKSDVTQELAEDAYFNYLKKLDEVSRLEIVGTYLEEQTPGNQDDDILHVVGRTNGNTREHYYRRFEYGYWTPWEKVPLNIEGDQVVLVVWKGRLFLFWVSILEKGAPGGRNKVIRTIGDESWGQNAKKDVEITLAWGEYYQGKWTSPKSTEMAAPLKISGVDGISPEQLQISVHTHKPPDLSERLKIAVNYVWTQDKFVLTFTSKNSPPSVRQGFDDELLGDVVTHNFGLFSSLAFYPDFYLSISIPSNNRIAMGQVLRVSVDQPSLSDEPVLGQELLTKSESFYDINWVRPLWQKIANQWEAPFFYSDEVGVFHVTANEERHLDLKRKDPGYYWVDTGFGADVHIPDLEEIPEISEDPLGPWIRPGVDPALLIAGDIRVVLGATKAFEFGGTRIGIGGVIPSTARRS